jgi:hypothetical protein
VVKCVPSISRRGGAIIPAASNRRSKKPAPSRKLVNLYYRQSGARGLVFHFKEGRWDIYESYTPATIADAFETAFTKIEDAVPGSLAKAEELDDAKWLKTSSRKRRYIARDPSLLYIDKPHLRSKAAKVYGFFIVTNIDWPDVPDIIKLGCKAAGIQSLPISLLKL